MYSVPCLVNYTKCKPYERKRHCENGMTEFYER